MNELDPFSAFINNPVPIEEQFPYRHGKLYRSIGEVVLFVLDSKHLVNSNRSLSVALGKTVCSCSYDDIEHRYDVDDYEVVGHEWVIRVEFQREEARDKFYNFLRDCDSDERSEFYNLYIKGWRKDGDNSIELRLVDESCMDGCY